jgi:uncharacterized protein (DUF2235 family)
VHYQAGVWAPLKEIPSGEVDSARPISSWILLNLVVVFGTGLSEIVRAAYGFLANNYEYGDKIYTFSFSRGAYVARSIVGLVADHGLLTKRGMDNFHAVYETFYNYDQEIPDVYADMRERQSIMIPSQEGVDMTTKDAGLKPVPPHAVEVVGVFDTVA